MTTATPDFICAGSSRCGSTWLHRALDEHPEIEMSDKKPLSYFNLNYHMGSDWYAAQLPDPSEDILVGETSPGYMKHPFAPERIAKTCPDIKILFTVRDPADRAFSEWWHERSFGHVDWEFETVFKYHAAFDMLLRPGFYNHLLRRYEQQFDASQLNVLFFEDFKNNNKRFIQDIYTLLEVDDEHTPSLVGQQVNEANHLPTRLNRLKAWVDSNMPSRVYEMMIKPAYQPIKPIVESDSIYRKGMSTDMRSDLEAVFIEDIHRLEERTGRDLSHWYSS